jgi:hypothetical protein
VLVALAGHTPRRVLALWGEGVAGVGCDQHEHLLPAVEEILVARGIRYHGFWRYQTM